MTDSVRFDEAWHNAIAEATSHLSGGDIVAVRDVLGRISIGVNSRDWDPALRSALLAGVKKAAGGFLSPAPIHNTADEYVATSLMDAGGRIISRVDGHALRVIERSTVGGEWARAGTSTATPTICMYGFKGGVGRTTATAVLARTLAESGRSVLVIDLDLESPGVSHLMLNDPPDFGVIDFLVEDAVGQSSDLDFVSRVPTENGDLFVAPAAGRPRVGYGVLSKLNRVYGALPPANGGTTPIGFGDRLEKCIERAKVLAGGPDVVILDCRSGIHDIAAVALTRLSNIRLLFADTGSQTRTGYAEMFRNWRETLGDHESFDALREGISMVWSMSTRATDPRAVSDFADAYQHVFAETLYDPAGSSALGDEFNFAPGNPDAPHYPIAIRHCPELVGLDSVSVADWYADEVVRASFGQFCRRTVELMEGMSGDAS